MVNIFSNVGFNMLEVVKKRDEEMLEGIFQMLESTISRFGTNMGDDSAINAITAKELGFTTVFIDNGEYYDATHTIKDIHEFEIQPNAGDHLITVVDEFGNEIKRQISISE